VPLRNFDELLAAVKEEDPRRVSVAAANDPASIEAMAMAVAEDLATGVLVGDSKKIMKIASKRKIDLGNIELVNEPDDIKAARKSVSLVTEGSADIAMKGHIHTDDFLRAVLDKEVGLRSGHVMSHVFIIEMEDRLLFITDGAMNIQPDVVQKAEIVLNAVHLAHIFGVRKPLVAALAAVELVNPKMAATMDAGALNTMWNRGQFSPAFVMDGPLAMDDAISPEAAKRKGIGGPVAGRADVLLVPDIEDGNILSKALIHVGGRRAAGVLVGASAPVVVTSRADSPQTKMLSIASAVLTSNVKRRLRLKIGKVHF
jgi:phosphate butyryltransferase